MLKTSAKHLLLTACLLAPVGFAAAQDPFTLDDIEVWVGTGTNEIGIAIDWDGFDNAGPSETAPSLAWGFRYNDPNTTAEDALRALLAADTRLVGKFQFFDFGGGPVPFLLGLGYDANGDGALNIENALGNPELFNPATGIAVAEEITGASSVDPNDAYIEDLFNGFWELSTTSGPTATGFVSSSSGIADVLLTPGMFLGFAFASDFSMSVAPNNIVAAVPEPSTLVLLIAGAGFYGRRRRA